MKKEDRQFEDFNIGDYVSFTRSYSKKDFSAFSKLSKDTNPLHHDVSYANLAGYDGNIVPMHLASAPFSAIAGTIFPGHRSLYLSTNIKAIQPIPYDLELTYSAKIISKQDAQNILTIKVLVVNNLKVYIEAELTVQVRTDIEANSYKETLPHKIQSSNYQCALITGANGSIGQAISKKLLEQNWNVVMHSRTKLKNIKVFEDIAEQNNVKLTNVTGDLNKPNQLSKLINLFSKTPITSLVHTASPGVFAPLDQLMNVNYNALTKISQSILNSMLIQQNGNIVFISSSALQHHPEGWENYVAAKAAGTSYIESINKNFKTYGINGKVIAPGYVLTPFSDNLRPINSEALLPEEVAEEIIESMNDNSSDNYIWLETQFKNHGKFGFYENNIPSTSTNEINTKVEPINSSASTDNNLPELIKKYFKLDSDINLDNQGLDITPGWDSLGHIQFLVYIEKQLSIKFSSSEISQTTRYQDLSKIVNQKTNG
jgi:short-subunit dehydrogenase/acyl carrier protein/acyl dehydratase